MPKQQLPEDHVQELVKFLSAHSAYNIAPGTAQRDERGRTGTQEFRIDIMVRNDNQAKGKDRELLDDQADLVRNQWNAIRDIAKIDKLGMKIERGSYGNGSIPVTLIIREDALESTLAKLKKVAPNIEYASGKKGDLQSYKLDTETVRAVVPADSINPPDSTAPGKNLLPALKRVYERHLRPYPLDNNITPQTDRSNDIATRMLEHPLSGDAIHKAGEVLLAEKRIEKAKQDMADALRVELYTAKKSGAKSVVLENITIDIPARTKQENVVDNVFEERLDLQKISQMTVSTSGKKPVQKLETSRGNEHFDQYIGAVKEYQRAHDTLSASIYHVELERVRAKKGNPNFNPNNQIKEELWQSSQAAASQFIEAARHNTMLFDKWLPKAKESQQPDGENKQSAKEERLRMLVDSAMQGTNLATADITTPAEDYFSPTQGAPAGSPRKLPSRIQGT